MMGVKINIGWPYPQVGVKRKREREELMKPNGKDIWQINSDHYLAFLVKLIIFS